MTETENLKPKAIKRLIKINRAIDVLNKRGLPYEYKPENAAIIIRTDKGTVVYLPASDKYTHNGESMAVGSVEALISYVCSLGIAERKKKVMPKLNSSNPYAQVNYEELISLTPVNKLAAINISKSDSIEALEDVRAIYNSYVLSVKRLNQLLGELPNGSPEYQELLAHKDAVFAEQKELKRKHPYLGRRRRGLNHFILDCIKENVSEEQWRAYVRQGEKLMFDHYFEGIEDD